MNVKCVILLLLTAIHHNETILEVKFRTYHNYFRDHIHILFFCTHNFICFKLLSHHLFLFVVRLEMLILLWNEIVLN